MPRSVYCGSDIPIYRLYPVNHIANMENVLVDGRLKIKTLKEGDKTHHSPKKGDEVYVHYLGTFENGTKFDSSKGRVKPFTFKVGEGRVIEGWEIGVTHMSVGEESQLTIHSDLAYGDEGYPGVIPKNATLIFNIKLLSINENPNPLIASGNDITWLI